ncbi:MAG: polyprenyl synthetase family protein [Sandaracinaceae bacterium]|nr:polyprenyl synthetase family protein [Sandaracinaceae bacterium]
MRWLSEVRAAVDERLESYFEDKRQRTRALAPEAVELLDAIRALTMRGGKRLRPALLHAAFEAVAPGRDHARTLDACAALELLQSYLLIHDDWMDHDEERRGGPSVHAALRDAHGGDAHLGASLAILAGNLASACAWELVTRDPPPEPIHARVVAEFLRMHQEVVLGQQLDLLKTEDVARMQQLKTGSYTVRGPLLLGAAFGEASEAQREALLAYGAPLGEAFQLRDDLLGTFGDPGATGKPVRGDLCEGKRTALVREAERRGDPRALAPLFAVLGDRGASEAALAQAREVLVATGAKAAVEAQLDALLAEAHAALDPARLAPEGITMLGALADALGRRDR